MLASLDTKVLVSFKVLSHWRIDYDIEGSTFQSIRTRCCTRVTDLNSVIQSTHCTFCCGIRIFTNEPPFIQASSPCEWRTLSLGSLSTQWIFRSTRARTDDSTETKNEAMSIGDLEYSASMAIKTT
ncbi:hypothetical protein TNCV_510871 [Trichonephila clavipes]|nr:hypothetical protein TNCV_510871 [Trichonephila clavipes]